MKPKRILMLRIAISVALVLFLVLSPRRLIEGNDTGSYHTFYENPTPDWYGIIDLWHIVGFKTYQGSVTDFLAAQAKRYGAQHPGVHIRVTGMSEAYYHGLVARGERPDGYSFPVGLLYAEQLRPIACSAPAFRSNLKFAQADGETLAAPYFFSAYVLLTNTQLAASGTGADASGTDAAAPFVTGSHPPVDPALLQSALANEPGKSQLSIPPLLAADAHLLGAAAPFARFSDGAIPYAVADLRALGDLSRRTEDQLLLAAAPYPAMTDLVQYLGVASNTDARRAQVLSDFFAFLLSEDEQARLPALGAFPVLENVPNLAFSEAILENCCTQSAQTRFPDAFLYQQQRDALIADAANALAGQAGGEASFQERFSVVFGG